MTNQNNITFNSDFCEYPVIKVVNGDGIVQGNFVITRNF